MYIQYAQLHILPAYYANTIKTTDLNATEYAEEPMVDLSSPQYKVKYRTKKPE